MLRFDRDPREEVFQVIAKSLGELDQVVASFAEDPEEAVHKLRRRLKFLRAVLRLLRSRLAEDAYASVISAIRNLKDAASGKRDADVLKHSLKLLAGATASTGDVDRLSHLVIHGGEAGKKLRDDLPGLHRKIITGAAELHDQIEALKAPRTDWRNIADAYADTYDRCQRRFEKARSSNTPEDFHRWRIAVKDLTAQSKLFEVAWPAVFRAIASASDRLGTILGWHHDVAVVRDHVETLPASARKECKAILEASAKAIYKAEKDAVSLGDSLLKVPPAAFRQVARELITGS